MVKCVTTTLGIVASKKNKLVCNCNHRELLLSFGFVTSSLLLSTVPQLHIITLESFVIVEKFFYLNDDVEYQMLYLKLIYCLIGPSELLISRD